MSPSSPSTSNEIIQSAIPHTINQSEKFLHKITVYNAKSPLAIKIA